MSLFNISDKSEEKKLSADAHFRSPEAAIEFFRKKDRSRPCDITDVVGIRTLSWNCDGTTLACGSQNKVVAAMALDQSCRLKLVFPGYGHEDQVDAVEFSKTNPQLLASCSSDKSLRVWDLKNKHSHTKITTKDANLFLTWSSDDKYIIYGDKSNILSLVDTRTYKTVQTYSFKEDSNEMAFHPNGNFLFVTTDAGKVEILSMPHLKLVKTIQAHPQLSMCQSLCVSPDEKYLVVGASDACCSVWDLKTLICVQSLLRLDYPVRTVSFSHCGKMIASGSEDHFIDISWAETGEKIAEIPISNECFDVAWHPRYYLLAYASSGATNERDRDRDSAISLRVFGYPSS